MKGGNYSREETICGNTVSNFGVVINCSIDFYYIFQFDLGSKYSSILDTRSSTLKYARKEAHTFPFNSAISIQQRVSQFVFDSALVDSL